MLETFFQEVTRFVRFSDADRACLVEFRDRAADHFPAIADAFYDRIAQHADARAVLGEGSRVRMLKRTLLHWLETLVGGPWDEAYHDVRARIGQAHLRAGVPQRYVVTTISMVRERLIHIARHAYEHNPQQHAATADAIGRVLDIDLTIMLETYQTAHASLIRDAEAKSRAQLRRQLAQSEARYEAIIEHAGALIVATDRAGDTVLFNRTAEELSGYSRTEMLGAATYIDRLCHSEDRAAAREAIQQIHAGTAPAPFEVRIVAKSGQVRWIRWHATSLASDDGLVACLIGIDITEERELHRRTQRAEQLAALGTLSAGLAHEIRNPLNAAKLQLMLVERRLAKSEPDAQARAIAAAQVVRDELERLAGLVQDFLAYARPTQLRPCAGDLLDTARGVVTLMEPDAAAAAVQLTLADGAPVRTVYDEERIKQVLLNLTRNALEAAGAGGSVSVEVHQIGSEAELVVLDNGPGVPPNLDIFSPFTTSKETGTGLGLPICARIVTDHRGDVSHERRADKTAFIVRLPLDGP